MGHVALFLGRFLGRTLGCDQHSHLLEGVKVLDVDATWCVQLETCAVKIHKNALINLIHRNGSPDFSNQSNTIQNNKKRETMGRQMLEKLCSSTAVDDGVTLRASAVHAYNAKLHDLLNLCSALKSACRVHAIWRVCFKKKKDTILTFNDGWHMIKTRHAQNVLFSCILTLRPFMVSPPPNMKYPECSGPQKKQIQYSSPGLGSLLLNLGEKGLYNWIMHVTTDTNPYIYLYNNWI